MEQPEKRKEEGAKKGRSAVVCAVAACGVCAVVLVCVGVLRLVGTGPVQGLVVLAPSNHSAHAGDLGNLDRPSIVLWSVVEDHPTEQLRAQCEKAHLFMHQVAERFPEYSVMVVDIRVGMFTGLLSAFGISPSETFAIAARSHQRTRHVLREFVQKEPDFDLGVLRAFIQDVEQGTAVRFVRSSPPPSSPTDSRGLTTVVGSTVDDAVLNATSPVLLWACVMVTKQCQQHRDNVLAEVASILANENVQIAILDLSDNDPPLWMDPHRDPNVYFKHPGEHAPEHSARLSGAFAPVGSFLRYVNERVQLSPAMQKRIASEGQHQEL